eukprot:jgi/Bigna1/145212/aug1.96_g19920
MFEDDPFLGKKPIIKNASNLDDLAVGKKKKIFNAADKNHDGSLDERELKIFLRQEVHFTEEEVKQVFAAFDDNKDGKINKEEFTMLLQQRETFKMEGVDIFGFILLYISHECGTGQRDMGYRFVHSYIMMSVQNSVVDP